MKTIVIFLIAICFCHVLLAQKSPRQIGLQKKTINDSVYLSNRWNTDLESNSIPEVNENELKDVSEQMPPLLQASRDPYATIASFQFAAMRMTARGLGNSLNQVMINGMPMADLTYGSGLWSSWNGLNSIFRIGETNTVYQQSDMGISILGTNSNIDIRPFKQKAAIDIGYGFANRGSTHRLNISMHSGLSIKGWSYGMAVSAKASIDPILPAGKNHGRSFYFGVDKKLGAGDMISLSVFGAFLASDKQASVLKESIKILDDYSYNPTWGYQNGLQRNANQSNQFMPTLMLTQEHKISNQSFIQTAVSFSTGYRNATGLDWYHAPDPRPDYYRYLPSYQTDPIIKEAETIALQTNVDLRQLNWQKFYQINDNSFEQINHANGTLGNTVSGKRARYILENRHQDIQRLQFATSYHGLLNDALFFSSGISVQIQKSHYYKSVADLLGASFYVNWNQFAESEIPNDPLAIQYNLARPNGIVYQGDRFGYDYHMFHHKTSLWFQTCLLYTSPSPRD